MPGKMDDKRARLKNLLRTKSKKNESTLPPGAEHPTDYVEMIDTMIAVWDRANTRRAVDLSRCTVPLTSGPGRPLFCVAGAGGDPLVFQPFVRELTGRLPVLGLIPKGMDGSQPPPRSVEDSAAYFIEVMKTHQPVGPYRLAGWCAGGYHAREIARQLVLGSAEVELLLIVDTYAHLTAIMDHGGRTLPEVMSLIFFLTTRAMGTPLKVPAEELAPLDLWGQVNLLVRRVQAAKLLPSGPEVAEGLIHQFTLSTVSLLAAWVYYPKPYPGKAIIFWSTDKDDRKEWGGDLHDNPTLGWGDVIDEIETIEVPGDHNSMLLPPGAGAMADHIFRLLGLADAG